MREQIGNNRMRTGKKPDWKKLLKLWVEIRQVDQKKVGSG